MARIDKFGGIYDSIKERIIFVFEDGIKVVGDEDYLGDKLEIFKAKDKVFKDGRMFGFVKGEQSKFGIEIGGVDTYGTEILKGVGF